ncbi:MAG: hypothetical protein DCC75_09200 [Proteobacteria bacterium]|nr:MAG: hypothetical protein DCC75_09200 [Pseudomonadota bacterium]
MQDSSALSANQEEVPSGRPAVLLDARKIGDGGIGSYIDSLVRGLLDSGQVKLSLVVSGDRAAETFLNSFSGRAFEAVIEEKAPKYSFDELFRMPKRINLSRFDLFHAPHYTLPFNLKVPSVVTIHDVIHLTHPPSFLHPFLARPLIRSALRRAARVIAVSQATAQALAELSKGISFKVEVVPNAFDSFLAEHFVASSPSLEEMLNCVWREFQIKPPYLLAVLSNNKPHKGGRDLLRAFAELRKLSPHRFEGPSPLRLVIAGSGGEALSGVNVISLGQVSRENLGNLYSLAEALVIPSLAEGFCLPALEAKILGARIIARPVSALREILGSGDSIAADFTVAELSRAMHVALSPEPEGKGRERRCSELSLSSTALLSTYSRQKLAERTAQVYLRALT